jgi:hypothetical protein
MEGGRKGVREGGREEGSQEGSKGGEGGRDLTCCAGDYSCLKVRLHFTRDKGFYYTTVFAPGESVPTSTAPTQASSSSCPPSSRSGLSTTPLRPGCSLVGLLRCSVVVL